MKSFFRFQNHAVFLMKTILVFSLLICMSCTKKEKVLDEGKTVLRVNNGDQPSTLDVQLVEAVGDANITGTIFMGLFEHHPQTNEPVNDLVLSYESNPETTEWTFKLRNDINWVHYENGQVVKKRPVTAQDFVYSYRRILDPVVASPYAQMLYVLKNGEKFFKGEVKDVTQIGVVAIDDYTLKLTLEGPDPGFIKKLVHHSFRPVPREPIEQFKEKWATPENIWTNNAFALREWKLKESVSVIKNPHFPGIQNVALDEISFRFLGVNSAEAMRAFEAGDIDLDTHGIIVSRIKDFRKDGRFQNEKMLGTYFFKLNTTKKPFDDIRVRQALNLTAPREEIVTMVTQAGEQPAYSFLPDAFEGFKPNNTIDPNMSYEDRVKEAKKLLAEAGFPDGKGFPEFKINYNTSESHQKIAVTLAKAWKNNLGINATPNNQEWKVHILSERNLEYEGVSRMAWIADYPDPATFLEILRSESPLNGTGFKNVEFDTLLSNAKKERDVAARNKILEQADALVMKNMPVIPIYYYTTKVLMQKHVSGFYPTKLDMHDFRTVKLDLNQKKQFLKSLEI